MKKTKPVKTYLAIVLTLCMCLSLCVTAFASDEGRDDGATRYTGVSTCYAGLSISGWGKATCSSYVSCNSGYSATLTMELKRGSTTIKTWDTSGSLVVEMEKTYYVVSGYIYQVVATIEVKDSHGTIVDTIEKSSYSVIF